MTNPTHGSNIYFLDGQRIPHWLVTLLCFSKRSLKIDSIRCPGKQDESLSTNGKAGLSVGFLGLARSVRFSIRSDPFTLPIALSPIQPAAPFN